MSCRLMTFSFLIHKFQFHISPLSWTPWPLCSNACHHTPSPSPSAAIGMPSLPYPQLPHTQISISCFPLPLGHPNCSALTHVVTCTLSSLSGLFHSPLHYQYAFPSISSVFSYINSIVSSNFMLSPPSWTPWPPCSNACCCSHPVLLPWWLFPPPSPCTIGTSPLPSPWFPHTQIP